MTTNNGHKEKVTLAASNWAGVIVTAALTVGGSIGGQVLLTQGRLSTAEANIRNSERRMDELGTRLDGTRREFVDALNGLRAELKTK
jgi:hypothetical protein